MADTALHGSIPAFRLPEVLVFLNTTRKSGALTVTGDAREATLYFDQGALVFATTNQESLRLGAILLRRKLISREQRDEIDRIMREAGERFGQVAVSQGAISEEQLRDYLKVQASEIIFDAFVWNGGTFVFRQELSLPPYAVTIAVDLANLMMEGARRIDEWEQCVKLLPDSAAVYRVVASPRDEKITLTSDEWKILFMINGQRTLEELCRDSEEDAFHVYRVVYGLLANQLVEPVPAVARASGASAPAVSYDSTMRQEAPHFGNEPTVSDEAVDADDTSLLISSNAHLSYSDVVRTTVAQFTVMTGPEQGTVIPLTEPEYLIGRHRENSIQVNDLGVSGFHARIYRGAEGYILEDLKSRNGTWINNVRVFHANLASGDLVHLGQTDLCFEVLL